MTERWRILQMYFPVEYNINTNVRDILLLVNFLQLLHFYLDVTKLEPILDYNILDRFYKQSLRIRETRYIYILSNSEFEANVVNIQGTSAGLRTLTGTSRHFL